MRLLLKFPTRVRCGLSTNIAFVLCLALFLTTGNGGILAAKEYKAQIVCQAWDEANQGLLGKVLILEQLSATMDASAWVAAAHQPPSTENTDFRLRIYDNVSLISNLPSLSGSDSEKRELAEISFSMGTRDADVVTSLRNRTAGVNASGREMDYTGHGRRMGSRLTFRSTWSNNSEKSLDLFLRSSRAIVDTKLGPSDPSEDGPYHCKEPRLVLEPGLVLEPDEELKPGEDLVLEPGENPETSENPETGENLEPGENLVLEQSENFSHCMRSSPMHVNLAVLAQDRPMVERIQRSLAQQGINPGPIDGMLGPRTTAALRVWHATLGEESSDSLRRDALCLLLHRLPQS